MNFNRNVRFESYIITDLGKQAGTVYSILDSIDTTLESKGVINKAKQKLIGLLEGSSNVPRFEGQNSSSYNLKGILKMFQVMEDNIPYTAAPQDAEERSRFYTKLAKGFMYLANTMENELRQGRMDTNNVYSCIDTIGTGGYWCAGRWRQGLEELLNGYADRLKEISSLQQDNGKDTLKAIIQNEFSKASEIEVNRAAEEFIKEYYPNIEVSNKLHYTMFFKRYLNETQGFHVPTSMEPDSYLGYAQNVIAGEIQDYLNSTSLEASIIKKFEALMNERIKTDDKVYRAIVDYANIIYNHHPQKDRYDDFVDFLSQKVFQDFSKDLRDKFALTIAMQKGCLKIEQKMEKLDHLIQRHFKSNQFSLIQDIIRDIVAKHPKEAQPNLIEAFVKHFRDKNYCTMLHHAVENKDSTFVAFLMQNKVNPNFMNSFAVSPLMMASFNGNTEITKILLSGGAKLNLQNLDGMTALMFAAGQGHLHTVKALLEAGADFELKNHFRYTAMRYAKEAGHKDIVEVIKQAQKNKIEEKMLQKRITKQNNKKNDLKKTSNKSIMSCFGR